MVRECGFRYLRFHGLFHDDMFVYREENGRAVFNFQYVDDLFDRMLAIGIRPFVELGFCPGDLASVRETVFWWKGHGSPPKDYDKWENLVSHFVTHCVARYGLDEVRQWYFEVWNEPNLHPFFHGTKSQYFELYKVSAQAIKDIDPKLRVGGPATSNFVPDARFDGETEDVSQHAVVVQAKDIDALEWKPVWVADFLAFCERENLPVDFVSCHPYPTDWALDQVGQTVKKTRGVDATRRDLTLLRKMVEGSPFPRAQIHLTEWSSSPSPRDFTHDYLQAATFIVKANLDSIGLADSLSYWTFTDVFEEGGAGDTMFHGGFGMISYQDIVKPAFHAYRFLHALGDEVIELGKSAIATRHRGSGKLTALAYHYPAEMPLAVPASMESRRKADETLGLGRPEKMNIEVTGLSPAAPVLIEILDKQHGNAMSAWEAMGSPDSPSRRQTEMLRQDALATKREMLSADEQGRFLLQREIAPWSIVLVKEQ